MIGTSRVVKVWGYARPADLRKGYNGLFGLVQQELRRDPLSGEMFIFVNRRRTSCKVLFWDGTGLCLFCKRLEQGLFAKLWERGEADEPVSLTSAELTLFIEGCELIGRQRLSPPESGPRPLVAVRRLRSDGVVDLRRRILSSCERSRWCSSRSWSDCSKSWPRRASDSMR